MGLSVSCTFVGVSPVCSEASYLRLSLLAVVIELEELCIGLISMSIVVFSL